MSDRVAIPKPVREKVLKEFNHRCAICGGDNPQIHHIDENPSSNDPMNLIPLCPNCHLSDQHDPTRSREPALLGLFRKYRDPTILKPQFYPLFTRLRFLDDAISRTNVLSLPHKAFELVDFVRELEMGKFYAGRIDVLVCHPGPFPPTEEVLKMRMKIDGVGMNVQDEENNDALYESKLRDAEMSIEDYRQKLCDVCDQVYDLAIELLRFQPW